MARRIPLLVDDFAYFSDGSVGQIEHESVLVQSEFGGGVCGSFHVETQGACRSLRPEKYESGSEWF